MDYPEKQIYPQLTDRLKAHSYYFESLEHVAPAHYDLDRKQYEPEGEKKEFPFNRSAVFFDFGDMKLDPKGAYSKRVTIPLTVIVVQDRYVDSADGAANQPAYLKMLEYKYIVNDILEYFAGECFSELHLQDIKTDKDNDNLMVERLIYEFKTTMQKNTIPPAP